MKTKIIKIIKMRRSVRRFKAAPFPEEQLYELLKAGSLAPSAGNVQPWKFYVIRNQKIREKLAAAALGQTWMLTAPVIIVVCADLLRSASSYGKRGSNLYALQDTAAAVQNILLCAVEIGLAACWVGAFREKDVAAALNIDPESMRPVALIPVGYAGESPARPPKRNLEEIIKFVE